MSAARLRNLPDHRGPVADALAALGPHRVCELLGVARGKSDRGTNVHPRFVCPKHGGSSLDVDVREGRLCVHCHGCGEVTGDVFDLVAAVYGLDTRRDFRKVLGVAAELAGMRLDEAPVALPPRTRPKPAPAPSLDVDTFDRIVAHMHERGRLDRLDDGDEVRAYLRGRRLLDLATDAGWFALPRVSAQRALVNELRDLVGLDALRLSGLVNDAATMFRHPANRLAIPWRTHGVDGLVVTLQRRVLDASEPRYVFPPGRSPIAPFVVVDDLEELEDAATVVVVEGAVDVLALRAGLHEKGETALVVGLPGVQRWSDEWRALLDGRHVRIAVDPDKAGEDAVAKLLAQCTHALSAERWKPKGSKDWADAWAKG
jgi:DNA primase